MSNLGNIIKTIRISVSNGASPLVSSGKVIQEINLAVRINGKPFAAIACAGIHLEELAAGFLKSERIITARDQIQNIKIGSSKNVVDVILKDEKYFPHASLKNIASSGSRGRINTHKLLPLKVASDFHVKAGLALKLMEDILNGSSIHNETGGTHCSALALKGKIIALREDIGRHNTIDMLGGYALLKKIKLNRAILLTTGRISSEIVHKVWNMGVPVIISHSAPTAEAVRLAKKADILLIGYVRNDKMNIYSHERRVII